MQPGADFAKELASQQGRTFDRQLVEIERASEELIADLSSNQANWSPSPPAWSMRSARLISAFPRGYTSCPLINRFKGGARPVLLEGVRSTTARLDDGWCENIEPPPRLKIKTGRAYAPPPSRPAAEVLSEFIDMHEKVRQRLRSSEGLDLARCKMSHPSLRIFVSAWVLDSQL
jgi:hypothetical protein